MTSPEQISWIINKALKSSLLLLPVMLCFCMRHFAIHLSYKQVQMAKFFTEGHWMEFRKKCPFPSPTFLLQPKLDGLVLSCLVMFPPLSPHSLHNTRDRAGRRGDEVSQSYQSNSPIKVAWIKSKTFCFAWNQAMEEGLNSHLLFLWLLREPELSTHQWSSKERL